MRASRSATSLKGLSRHSTAPCAISLRRTASSPCAVTKMIGVEIRRRFNSNCNSGPDIPGIAMSRIRHLVREMVSEARNSSAEENVCAGKPSSLNNPGKDSRIDSSSSTTDMSERVFVMFVSCRTHGLCGHWDRFATAVNCEAGLFPNYASKCPLETDRICG